MTKRKELLGIFVYSLIVAFFVLEYNSGYFFSLLLYLGVPSGYLTIKNPKVFQKTLLYSLLLPIPFAFITDYIATVSQSWWEATHSGILILNVFPIEILLWGFLYSFFVISFYEYFFDRDRNKKKFSKKIKNLMIFIGSFASIFGAIYLIDKELLVIEYFYIIFISAFFIFPSTLISWNHPKLLGKALLQAFYFLIITLIYDLTAIHNGQWGFDGDYIGWIEILGVGFPFEEFLFLLLAPLAYILLYEYFADDQK